MDVKDLYRATLTATDDAAAAGEPVRARDAWWARVAFGLLFVGAVALMFMPRRENHSAEDWVALVVGSGGVAVASLGLLVPWWRIGALRRALHTPGRQLAALSRFAGWFGLGALPVVALTAPWWANPLVAVLPFAALALWRRRAWAAWVWYAVGLAALGGGLWRMWLIVASLIARVQGEVIAADEKSRVGGGLLGGFLLVALGVVVLRDTYAFKKSLRRP